MSAPHLTLALVATLSAAMIPSAHARGGTDFNGGWSVELVTESGLCDSRYTYAIFVRDGRVRLASSAGAATLTGSVGADGTVGLTVSKGGASGSASGTLRARSGAGAWTVSSLCSGRWTATRHAARTASAE